jgi:excisionase family DNA binding protein
VASSTDKPASTPAASSLEWMDLKALKRYAAVSERTLREWMHRGQNPLPAARVGTKILVSRRRFDAWLEEHPVLADVDVRGIVEQVASEVLGRS